MRNWGIVVTGLYAVIVLLLLSVGMVLLAEGREAFAMWPPADFQDLLLLAMVVTGILLCGEGLLLFLSVDTSWRRLKPQRHAKVTAGLVGIMVTVLFVAVCFAIAAAVWGDNVDIPILDDVDQKEIQLVVFLATVGIIWIIWGVVFYRYSKRSSDVADSGVSWLMKGSVLELLVAVPCHIIVRQREWCCAQYVSAYGIAAGIAIMLMAFGPSAMFLYKKKLDEYKNRTAP